MENIGKQDQAMAQQAGIMLTAAKSLVITNQTQNEEAGDTLLQIKKKAKSIKDRQTEMTRPLNEAKKSIMDFFRGPLDYLKDAEDLIKKAMLAYKQEQDRIQREREEEARRIAEEEAERIRAAADVEAKKLEKNGDAGAAEKLRREASNYVAPVVVAPAPTKKVAGVHTRKVWKGECFDINLLLGAIVKGQAPVHLVKLDQAALDKLAVALKEEMRIPGCKAYEHESIVGRG